MTAGFSTTVARPGRCLLPLLIVLSVCLLLCGLTTTGEAVLDPFVYHVVGLQAYLSLPDVSYNKVLDKYLVVWQLLLLSYNPNPVSAQEPEPLWQIWGQIVKPDGKPYGPPFVIYADLVPASPMHSAHDPRVAAADQDDGWVVTYVVDSYLHSNPPSSEAPSSWEVQACVVRVVGSATYVWPPQDPLNQGRRSIVNAEPFFYPIAHADIGATTYLGSGRYLIIWDAGIPPGPYSDIRGRLAQVDYTTPTNGLVVLGREFPIDTGYDSRNPAINQRGRGFLVAFEDHGLFPYYGLVSIIASPVTAQGIVSPYQLLIWDDVLGDPEYPQVLPNSRPRVAANWPLDPVVPELYAVVWQYVVNYNRLPNDPTDPPVFNVGYAIITGAAIPSFPGASFIPYWSVGDGSRAEPSVANLGSGGIFVMCYADTWTDPRPSKAPYKARAITDVVGCELDATGRIGPPQVYTDYIWLNAGTNYRHPEGTLFSSDDGETKVVTVWDHWSTPHPYDEPPVPAAPGLNIYSRWWWPGDTTVGLYDPTAGKFFLREDNSVGVATVTVRYGPSSTTWRPLTGDWNGDMLDTLGLYDPTGGKFWLRNSNDPGVADLTIRRGPAPSTWKPIVGDWDGDGADTPGLYDPVLSAFHLWNLDLDDPVNGHLVAFGPAGCNWTPIAGDWNGDGVDTVGLYDPTTGRFHLRNQHASGPADLTFRYGPVPIPPSPWSPVVGDWNGDGVDTVGLYSQSTGTFYLRNSNTAGGANILPFRYGPAPNSWLPVVGNWDGM